MSERQSWAGFGKTSWTLVSRAREHRVDLEKLLAQYWSPVYAFLRRKGHKPADAEDLTQAFLARICESRDLLEKADPDRGRFRSLLIAALKRFVIDEHRREHGRNGQRAPTFVPDDPRLLAQAEPSNADDPAQAFYRQWATVVLDSALRHVEESCHREGLVRQWTAFEARVVHPAKQGCDPVPIESLVAQLDAKSSQEIYSMVQTIKRKLDRAIQSVVSDTVSDPNEVAVEMKELRAFLAPGASDE